MKSSVVNPTGGAPEDYVVAKTAAAGARPAFNGNSGIRPRKGARKPSGSQVMWGETRAADG